MAEDLIDHNDDHARRRPMNQKNLKQLALGAAIAGSLAAVSVAQANPFSLTALGSAYMAAAAGDAGADKAKGEGKCGEGKCGADKAKGEGKCGEGKCGANKAKGEGKCGEGKCGAKKEGEKTEGEKKPEQA
jgi:uncharacterized low-complexity protein